MSHNGIIQLLDELAELQAQTDVLRLKKQAVIDGILTPEIKAQLAEIDTEYAPALDAAAEKSADLEERIKTTVTAVGESVKGERLHAVFNKGRVSWDTKRLDSYATAHPEIEAFRKVGNPSVSIRQVK